MQVGDLVKFIHQISGLEDELGIIIAFNGGSPVVQWCRLGTVTEPPEVLEVISGSRRLGETQG